MKSRSVKSVAILAVLLALLLSVMPSMAQNFLPDAPRFQVPEGDRNAPELATDNLVRDANGRVAYVVTLSEAAAVTSAARDVQARAVSAQQANFMAAARSLGVTQYASSRYILNSVSVFADPGQLAALRALPGVVSVTPSKIYERTDTTSTAHIGASTVWSSTGAGVTGDGVVVAVIDDGIDYSHKHFGGTGDYATEVGDRTVLENGAATFGAFPIINVGDQKVVGGYDFVGDAYDASDPLNATPVPDPDPPSCTVDEGGGHGTHVAGSVAGYGVTSGGDTYTGTLDTLFTATYPDVDPNFLIGPGVAPRAALVALKVFGCDGSVDDGPLIAAIDAAVAGGYDTTGDDVLDVTFPPADVINMSLGSAFSGSDGPWFDAITNAVVAGVTVVHSAGNSGDHNYVTGSANEALTVASVTDTTNVGGAIEVTIDGNTTTHFAAYGTYGPLKPPATNVTEFIRPDGTTNNNVQLGCNAGDWVELSGETVLIDRGTCTFFAKLNNAFNFGAGAVIMISDGRPPGGMGGDAIPGYDLISVMISDVDGVVVKDALNASTLENVLFDGGLAFVQPTDPNLPDSFTSRGPAFGTRDGMKPDVASIGSTVTSAASGTGTLPSNLSGTSMAAPHAAGLVALIAEKYPDLEAWQRKAVAMNTATDLVNGNGVDDPIWAPQRVGTGITNAVNAVNTNVLAYAEDNPAGVSVRFGHYNVAAGEEIYEERRIILENWGTTDETYAVSVVTISDIGGLEVTVNKDSVTVPAGGTAAVKVILSGTIDHDVADVLSDPTWSQFWWPILEEGTLVRFDTDSGASDLHVIAYGSALLRSDVTVGTDTLTVAESEGLLTVPVTGESIAECGLEDCPISVTSLFNLAYEAPAEAAVTDLEASIGQIKAVGTSVDVVDTFTSYFAIALGDTFLYPNEVDTQVWLDMDQNGTFEWILYLNPYYSVNNFGLPTPASCFADIEGNYGPAGAGYCFTLFVNDWYSFALNTYTHGNSVMVIPTYLDFFEFYSTGGFEGNYDFIVGTFDWQTGDLIDVTGDPADSATWQTANYFAPGVAATVDLTGDGFLFPAGDLGAGVGVQAYYGGEVGTPDQLLAIHHHNASSAPAYEVIDLVVDANSQFALTAPANNTVVFDPGNIEEVTWEQGGHEYFDFILMQVSTNTPVDGVAAAPGVIAEFEGLTADQFDEDPLACDGNNCSLFIGGALDFLETGTYFWTVTANVGWPSEKEAYNGPFQFAVYRNDLDLLVNGGMEVDVDNNKQPDGWKIKRAKASKIKCDNPDKNKFVANSGECAYMFKGKDTRAQVQQVAAAGNLLGAGTEVNFDFYADSNQTASNFAVIVAKYTTIDPNTGKNVREKFRFDVEGPTDDGNTENTTDYELISNSVVLTDSIDKLKFQFRERLTGGKIWLDDVRAWVPGIDGAPLADDVAANVARGLVPVPEAPEEFKGR